MKRKQNFENTIAKLSKEQVIDRARLNDLRGGNGHGHPPPSN